jgi:hypothetical protein
MIGLLKNNNYKDNLIELKTIPRTKPGIYR